MTTDFVQTPHFLETIYREIARSGTTVAIRTAAARVPGEPTEENVMELVTLMHADDTSTSREQLAVLSIVSAFTNAILGTEAA